MSAGIGCNMNRSAPPVDDASQDALSAVGSAFPCHRGLGLGHLAENIGQDVGCAETDSSDRVCLLLQDLLQSCSRGGEEESGRHVL